MDAVLKAAGLKKYYGKGEALVKALDGVDLEIERGKFTAIIGTSGSGKSTLLNMLGGLDTPTEGSIRIGNTELAKLTSEEATVFRRKQIGFIFQQFNLEKPVDFHSPSMSVSDIVALKQNGVVSCHYVDSVGFQQIPGFLPENHLKNAEMTVEDDYGMIDGVINNGSKEPTVAQLEQQARSGQPISLMDLAAAAHREEREKRKSVVEQLRSQPKTEHKKTAPKKSAEREI